jgi:two-component system LytT family response regulator
MHLENAQKMETIKFLRFIEVRNGNKRTFLPIAKILHIDASSNYTTIHADGYQPVMVAKVLKKYQQLLEGHGFMRINNSVLINTNRVREIHEDGGVVMENESMFYPSRRRKSEMKNLLLLSIG